MDGGYYLQVEVRGETARLRGRQIGRPAEHLYPASFRRFAVAIDPRYFQGVWDLPASPTLRNGDFEQGLEGWSAVFRYQADKDPGYSAAVTSEGASGTKSVCLFVGERGQGWALGEFTEIYQVFRAPGPAPVLKFNYRSGPGTNGGGYVWLAGFKGQEVRSVMVFHWGPQMRAKHTLPRVIDYVVTAGEHGGTRLRSLSQQNQALFWKLPVPGDRWVPVTINLAQALNAAAGKPGQYESLGHDRLIIGLGAWCSDQQGSRSTASFDDVGLISDSESRVMQVNGQPFDAIQQGFSLIVSEE
jgi:hypothetical protein